jgi:hydrogenase 3 maturation protease
MSPGWRSALHREVAAARRLVILGVGAPENGDDAAGVFCAEEIRRGLRGGRFRRARVLVSADVPESATGPIRRFRPTLVLIVDAALSNRRPGAVFFVERRDLAEESLTTHAIPLSFLLDYTEATIGCRVLLLGIQPKVVARGAPLSAPVRSSAPAVAEEILAGLRESPAGHPVRSS